MSPSNATRAKNDGKAQASDHSITVGDLRFDVLLSPKRRTIQISVERNGALSVSAPTGVNDAQLRKAVQQKRFWIYTKLAERDRLQHPVRHKEFVGGEGFLYLGRSYRLKLVDKQDAPLKLTGGRFVLRRDALQRAREHFRRWYSEHARAWLTGRVEEFRSRMEVQPQGVRVQELGYRWGSCGKGNWVYFHWKTILLPARIVEYIVVHEIAHLLEPHHTPEFWRRVERVMPDYSRRKDWLSEHGIDVEGI